MKKENKNISTRELALGYAAMIAVVFGFILYVFIPLQGKVSNKKTQVTTLDEKIQRNNKLTSEFNTRSLAAAGPMKDAVIGKYVASSQRLAQIVSHLIAADKNLETRMIKIEKSKKELTHKDVSFKVELIGSFPAIGAFVERLENTHILAKVIAVDIERVGTDLDKCIAKISVNARLFNEDEND